MVTCIFDYISIISHRLRDLRILVDLLANIIFYCTIGCMAAQVNYEVSYRKMMENESSRTVITPMKPSVIVEGIPVNETTLLHNTRYFPSLY